MSDSCRVEGYRAFYDNILEENNPYVGNTEEYEQWAEGWYDAYTEWFWKDFTPDWFESR